MARMGCQGLGTHSGHFLDTRERVARGPWRHPEGHTSVFGETLGDTPKQIPRKKYGINVTQFRTLLGTTPPPPRKYSENNSHRIFL